MDCDTTGIEPDFALVKFKKLAGGGYFKIVNQSVPEALKRLGYSRARSAGDRRLSSRAPTRCLAAPHINRRTLRENAASTTPISRRSKRRCPACSSSTSPSDPWVLGEEAYDRVGATKRCQRSKKGF